MALREFEAVKGAVPDARFVDAYDIVWGCRVIKSKLEIERIEKASVMTCNAIKKVFESRIREGMTEVEYAKEMAIAFLEEGAEARDGGFLYVGVMNDPWLGPMLDRAPTDRRLKRGDMLTADCGAAYGGYTSDMTRWAVIGEPPEKMKELYHLALQSTISAEKAVRSGIPISDLVKAANDPFKKAGFPMAIARIGHGLGLDVHEPPSLGEDNRDLIQPGMVLTIEPCLLYNDFIIWIEDVIRAIMEISENDKYLGKAINIGTGKGTTIRELAKRLVKMTNSKSSIIIEKRRDIEVKKFFSKSNKFNIKTLELDEGLKKLIELELKRT